MSKINNVLFICSGNTCRSPFAEYIAKWLKDTEFKEELSGVNFDSAGLYHYYEYPQEGTVKYLESKGINFSDFKAKQVDEELIEKQDLILGFEKKWHIRKLKRRFKSLKNLDTKLFLLLEFAGNKENFEVEDPIYLEREEYNNVLKVIESGVKESIKRIIEINKKMSNDS